MQVKLQEAFDTVTFFQTDKLDCSKLTQNERVVAIHHDINVFFHTDFSFLLFEYKRTIHLLQTLFSA